MHASHGMYLADDSEAQLRILMAKVQATRERLREEVERSRVLRARVRLLIELAGRPYW